VSWARDAVSAIRKIVLIEDRMEALTVQVKHLADGYTDLDRRLVRLEAKFDLIEKMAAPGQRALPAKSQSHKDKKKTS
jgi:predicted  nucleic acid-binding Zn-ribbon protein